MNLPYFIGMRLNIQAVWGLGLEIAGHISARHILYVLSFFWKVHEIHKKSEASGQGRVRGRGDELGWFGGEVLNL